MANADAPEGRLRALAISWIGKPALLLWPAKALIFDAVEDATLYRVFLFYSVTVAYMKKAPGRFGSGLLVGVVSVGTSQVLWWDWR